MDQPTTVAYGFNLRYFQTGFGSQLTVVAVQADGETEDEFRGRAREALELWIGLDGAFLTSGHILLTLRMGRKV
jgi:hypothetical protein